MPFDEQLRLLHPDCAPVRQLAVGTSVFRLEPLDVVAQGFAEHGATPGGLGLDSTPQLCRCLAKLLPHRNEFPFVAIVQLGGRLRPNGEFLPERFRIGWEERNRRQPLRQCKHPAGIDTIGFAVMPGHTGFAVAGNLLGDSQSLGRPYGRFGASMFFDEIPQLAQHHLATLGFPQIRPQSELGLGDFAVGAGLPTELSDKLSIALGLPSLTCASGHTLTPIIQSCRGVLSDNGAALSDN